MTRSPCPLGLQRMDIGLAGASRSESGPEPLPPMARPGPPAPGSCSGSSRCSDDGHPDPIMACPAEAAEGSVPVEGSRQSALPNLRLVRGVPRLVPGEFARNSPQSCHGDPSAGAIGRWLDEYNTVRLRGALGALNPRQFLRFPSEQTTLPASQSPEVVDGPKNPGLPWIPTSVSRSPFRPTASRDALSKRDPGQGRPHNPRSI